MEMLRELRKGNSMFITPDGPRGPRYTVQSGAAVVAQKSGVPVVPVSINAPKRWELKGWDRTQIPKPFSRITFQYGRPLVLDANAAENSEEQNPTEANMNHLKEALLQITDDSV